MSDMKCPICGNALEQSDGFPELFMCLNCQINMKHNQWQELIRIRKALDVALCSLQDIAESNGDFITGASTTLDAQEYAEMMLDKIKFALKQKD